MKALKWMAGIFGVFVLLALAGAMFAPEPEPPLTAEPTAEPAAEAVIPAPAEAPSAPRYQLEMLAMTWTDAHGYETVEGLVKNISDQPLRGVRAVMLYEDKAGEFITSDGSYVQYQPIMPGQESPFKVMTRSNPAMATVKPSFEMRGAAIPTKDRGKP